jgi:hypothetical protein
MKNTRLLLLLAAISCPRLAGAQAADKSQAIAPPPPVQLNEKDALKTFDANERTDIDAIKNDSSVAAIKKKQQIADLKKDDKAKRSALREKYAEKREAIHDVIRTNAAEDRRERAERSGRR